MNESTQHKLDRIRPPRVQITYDVEIGDAIEMKELPLVVGIMADLSGKPEEAPPKMRDRKFVEIDRDNFNDVMKSIRPRLALRVTDTLKDDGDSMLSAVMHFESLDDFSPASVAAQVDPLNKLLNARQRLVDLLAKLDGNDDLDDMLRQVLGDEGVKNDIKSALDAAGGSSGDGAPADDAGEGE